MPRSSPSLGRRSVRPRCARVFLRLPGKATGYYADTVVLCEECRKEQRGQYRLDERHK